MPTEQLPQPDWTEAVRLHTLFLEEVRKQAALMKPKRRSKFQDSIDKALAKRQRVRFKTTQPE